METERKAKMHLAFLHLWSFEKVPGLSPLQWYQIIIHHLSGFLYAGTNLQNLNLKFIYSEKVTKFCKISTLLLSYVVPVKSKVEISQNFVVFSEYMNILKEMQCFNFEKFGLLKMSLPRLKFIYFKKAAKFCEISTLLLTGTT